MSEKLLFTWLHISDIHFSHGDEHWQTDQELVLEAVISELKEKLKEDRGLFSKLDAVFVTGDIAFSGKKSQYDKAKEWLIKIAKEASISMEQIFVIPGNHDIQREVYKNDDDILLLIDSLRNKNKTLSWALSKEPQVEKLRKRFENYLSFANEFAPYCLLPKDNKNDLFWKHTLSTSNPDINIHLLGLNTALLSQENDKNNLYLSLEQIKKLPNIKNNPNEFCIALSHHPVNWLQDKNDVDSWLKQKCHMHLSGHIHQQSTSSFISGGGNELIRIQAGAMHNDQSDMSAPHSFSMGALVALPNDQVVVRVTNLIWSERNKDFREDSESHLKGKNYAEHHISLFHYVQNKNVSQEIEDEQITDVVINDKNILIQILKSKIESVLTNLKYFISIDNENKILDFHYLTSVSTHYELQKELIALFSAFDISTSIYELITIQIIVPTKQNLEHTKFEPTSLLLKVNMIDLLSLKNEQLSIQSVWENIRFYQLSDVATLNFNIKPVRFPYARF